MSKLKNNYDECRKEFSSIFYQNNLNMLTNGWVTIFFHLTLFLGKDLGFDDIENQDNIGIYN